MKIESPVVLLRNFFGANPTLVMENYTGFVIAPHAETSRISYTVPAGKRLLINIVYFTAMRRTVATVSGRVSLYLLFGAPINKIYADLFFADNTVGSEHQHSSTPNLLIPSGTPLTVYSEDVSSGGEMSYVATLGGILIDY